MVEWDVDRYDQLQDAAWELELLAGAQDRDVDRDAGRPNGDMSRTTARAFRQQAAGLLARYWEPRSPSM